MNLYKYINFAEETRKKKESKKKSFLKKHWKKLALGAGLATVGVGGYALLKNNDALKKALAEMKRQKELEDTNKAIEANNNLPSFKKSPEEKARAAKLAQKMKEQKASQGDPNVRRLPDYDRGPGKIIPDNKSPYYVDKWGNKIDRRTGKPYDPKVYLKPL